MRFLISTNGFCDVVDITDRTSAAVAELGASNGVCFISCPGSTCGITTIEFEPGRSCGSERRA